MMKKNESAGYKLNKKPSEGWVIKTKRRKNSFLLPRKIKAKSNQLLLFKKFF
jgi:hypothetical protein